MRVYDLGNTLWINVPSYTHPNHTGDVTSVGDGALTIANNAVTTAKINNGAVTTDKLGNGAVTLPKMADMATASMLGRDTAGTGSPEVLSAAETRANIAAAGTGTTNFFTESQSVDLSTLADNPTIAWNLAAEQNAEVTLGSTRVLGLPTNIVETTYVTLAVKQDGTGSRLLTYNAAFDFGDDGAPTLSTTANKVDVLTFMTVSTNKLRFLGIKTGFSN